MKLFWDFKNKLLSGRKSHRFEFSGQVNSVFPNSENKSRLPVVLFFKKVLFSFRSTINCSKPCSDVEWLVPRHFKISLGSFGSNSCYIHFDVLQCILNGFSCCTLFPIQEKGIGIVSYLVSKLRKNCPAPFFMTSKWARAATLRGIRTSATEDECQWCPCLLMQNFGGKQGGLWEICKWRIHKLFHTFHSQ